MAKPSMTAESTEAKDTVNTFAFWGERTKLNEEYACRLGYATRDSNARRSR